MNCTKNTNNWVKVFKNGPSKICGRQPLSNLLKAVFHNFYLISSWIPWPNCIIYPIARGLNTFLSSLFCSNLIYGHYYPQNIHLVKVKNRNTGRRYGICSKLTIKIPRRHYWRRSGVFIFNYDLTPFSSVSIFDFEQATTFCVDGYL